MLGCPTWSASFPFCIEFPWLLSRDQLTACVWVFLGSTLRHGSPSLLFPQCLDVLVVAALEEVSVLGLVFLLQHCGATLMLTGVFQILSQRAQVKRCAGQGVGTGCGPSLGTTLQVPHGQGYLAPRKPLLGSCESLMS